MLGVLGHAWSRKLGIQTQPLFEVLPALQKDINHRYYRRPMGFASFFGKGGVAVAVSARRGALGAGLR